MPRPGRPWYRTERGEWFATIRGKQMPLGITDPGDEAGAAEARRKLLEELTAAVAANLKSPAPPSRTVGEAVAAFLEECGDKLARGKVAAGTVANYTLALGRLRGSFGTRPIASLTAESVEDWADGFGWSQSTKNSYLGTVQTLLKWAGCPLRLRRPPKESRGAETCLTDEQFAQVLAALPDRARGGVGDLKQLLSVLRETGGRPQELARLTVEAVDWANGCARLKEHKTRRHTGRDRVIYFNTAALAVLAAQRAKHGTGWLFRTKRNRPYRQRYVVRELGGVSKRLGFRVIAYGLGRHSFATRALVAGVPDAVVAELLGHTSPAMVAKHYAHVGGQSRILRDAAEKASGRKEVPKAG